MNFVFCRFGRRLDLFDGLFLAPRACPWNWAMARRNTTVVELTIL